VNILLVEADYLLGRSMAQLLERSGEHRVRFTHKATDVFRVCNAGMADMVIVDANLAGTFWEEKEITGVDLSRLLKQHPQTAHLPIMLLSSRSGCANRVSLLSEALADDLYCKPIKDATDFVARLAAMSTHDCGFQDLTASAS